MMFLLLPYNIYRSEEYVSGIVLATELSQKRYNASGYDS